MSVKRIAFIGATGMLGKPVVREMIKEGFEVTAMIRNPPAIESPLPSTVKFIKGDLRNLNDIENLLANQDVLYLNLSIRPNERQSDFHSESDGLKNIIRAAQKSNIKRIVFLSSLVMSYQGMNNFSWWAFDVKRMAVDLLHSSGIPYTIFYPSSFMENFEGNYRMGNLLLLAGESHHKMYFIAGEDYARQVVASLRLEEAINRDYMVQGLEGFTADEAARIYVENYRKSKLRIAKMPLSFLKAFGKISRTAEYGAKILEALNSYPEKFEAAPTWNELGRPTITLARYAAIKGS